MCAAGQAMDYPLMITVLVFPVPGGRLCDGAHAVRGQLCVTGPAAGPVR